MTPEIKVSLLTPSIPNFIRTEDGRTVPVQDLDDRVLRALAKNWTALLLLSARSKRRSRAPHPPTRKQRRER